MTGVAPAVGLGVREAVDEREQARRRGDRAGDVEPRPGRRRRRGAADAAGDRGGDRRTRFTRTGTSASEASR